MKTLRDVKVGEKATIARLHGEGALKRRIMDMGLTRGTEVFVRKVAPLGDPMELAGRHGRKEGGAAATGTAATAAAAIKKRLVFIISLF